MDIQLNEERTSMWGLLETDIFLTFSNPGPVPIDWNNLTLQQQIALRGALLQEQVMRLDSKEIPEIDKAPTLSQKEENGSSVVTDPFRQEIVPKATGLVAADIDKLATQRQKERKDLEKDAKKLLRKHAGTIKTTLANATLDHMPLVQTMQKLELEKKTTRKKIIKILNETMERIQSQAAEAIENSFFVEETNDTNIEKKYKEPKLPENIEITALHDETGESIEIDPSTGSVRKIKG